MNNTLSELNAFFRFITVKTSYLDVPRIHFKGKFRADVNTRNNCQCNFRSDLPLNQGEEWNFNGTAEWEFIDTHVSSVIDQSGEENPNSLFMGARVFSNDNEPLAKIVDFDVDFQISSLYGLKFGIEINGEILLKGDWLTSVIVCDMWKKIICTLPGEIHSNLACYGTISTSRITNIEWSDKANDLRQATLCNDCTGDLSVSIALIYYSQEVFTLGNVVGTIGAAKKGESLNVGGDRKLESTEALLTFPKDHICSRDGVDHRALKQLTGVAPFTFDKFRKTLIVDISNAFPVDCHNKPIDLGELWLGIISDETVTIFGDPIPYKNPSLMDHGGIIEQVTDTISVPLENSLLVIIKEVFSNSSGSDIYPISEAFPFLKRENLRGQLLMKELKYFIRPISHYMDKLEFSSLNGIPKTLSEVTLLVSSFGQHVEGALVNIEASDSAIPEGGIIAMAYSNVTNNNGLVTFTFKANKEIPSIRLYEEYPCTENCPNETFSSSQIKANGSFSKIAKYQLPIDGQVYHFCYYVVNNSNRCENMLSFRSYSTMNYTRPYNWVDHVSPIFVQYHHLVNIMRTIVDLSNYTEVTLPYNIRLLRISFTQDINDANYMPVTRDLSPTKRDMILEWLENPCYDAKCINKPNSVVTSPPICQTLTGNSSTATNGGILAWISTFITALIWPPVHFDPPRCKHTPHIPYNSDPEQHDPFFKSIKEFELAENTARPLLGYGSNNKVFKGSFPECSTKSLKDQLQLAVQLEFATIPLYLTSLYSIVEGCNVEAYQLMRNIVIQEMLHFSQAANILIAIGGNVVIDDAKAVPNYPLDKLPGGVLPGLKLYLKKFTLEHVYHNFMAIETPMISCTFFPEVEWHLHTISQFYLEIDHCLYTLRNSIFVSGSEEKQVEWPWGKQVGTLYKVTDWVSARKAINEIIEQGEGARLGPLDPSTDQYAHFYRFEEIVCQHKLKRMPTGYAFNGDPIPYNPKGVWPMRDNPSKDNIESGSECDTEARAFHSVYRNFLRVLQDAFNGHPQKITLAVKLMESLQVHAKKTMWTSFNSDSTCGPVWDYEWD